MFQFSTVVDIYGEDITMETIQEELRANPSRLEEKKDSDSRYRQDFDEGNTPLISSAKFGNYPVVEFLLSVGADVEAKNQVSCFIWSVPNTFFSFCFEIRQLRNQKTSTIKRYQFCFVF